VHFALACWRRLDWSLAWSLIDLSVLVYLCVYLACVVLLIGPMIVSAMMAFFWRKLLFNASDTTPDTKLVTKRLLAETLYVYMPVELWKILSAGSTR
jgi:hypothetical protein